MTGLAGTVKIGHRRIKKNRLIAVTVTMVVTVGAAFAYWGSGSVPGGNGATAATAVNQGATPTAVSTGSAVTLTWAASTMTGGGAVSGYLVSRYDSSTLVAQTIQTACTGTVAATTCIESAVPTGTWVYSVTPVVGTNWRGAESLKSNAVTTDSTAPANAVTTVTVSGNANQVGTNVYYRGTALGSLKLANAVTDSGSGPASSATAALGGTTTGWTHTTSTVTTPAGGPYVSNVFSWTSGTTSSPTEVVTGKDAAGNTAATTLTFVNDSTGPTGTVSYTNGFQTDRTADVTFTSADAGSGVATRQLQRKSATLTGGVCGSYSLFANIGPANPTSPYTDSSVVNGVCYLYQYVLTDALGNTSTVTSASVSKVDYNGAVLATTGLLSMWRLGEASASPYSADSFTGTSASALTSHVGELGATWANQAGASSSNSEQISSQGRVFRSATGQTVDYTTTTPASADYSVEADIYYKGAVSNASAGVVGRLVTGTSQYYTASWETDKTWKITKWNGTTPTVLASTTVQADLTVGQTYRVRLTMSGSASTALTLYVNRVLKIGTTDSTSPLTAAGQAGIIDGKTGSLTSSDTVGLHLDNFQTMSSTYPRAVDSKGSNSADYQNGPTLGVSGALPGDANTAVTLDGVNDDIQAVSTTGIPVGASARSVEMWFKTTSAAQQVLFAYGTLSAGQEFGLWLNAGGASMTAWGYSGANDRTFTLPSAVNDGAWHQVVETYDGTNVTLYIDGVSVGSQAVTLATVIDQYGFDIGAVINPADSVNSGMFFKGSLDEVSLYTTALSAATVTDHFQFADTAGPTGGSVVATGLVGTGGLYSTSTTLSLTLAKGSDPSGLAASGNLLQRATATLTSTAGANGVCGTFGSYTLVSGGTDPASPKTDVVADQACYSYRYLVSDAVGNVTTYTSGNIKVDTTAPAAPSLSFSNISSTYWPGSGSVVYYSAAANGAFTATATATDAVSGVSAYTFPSLGVNWVATPGALGVTTYSWSSPPAVPGTKSVTATNNATGTSAGGSFTPTLDSVAPTTGTITYANTTQTSTSVSVSFTTGTDGGSGMGTRVLQRAAASLTAGVCGAYNPFVTVAGGTNPSSPFVDTVTRGACYQYQYVTSDNVGNQGAGATSTNVVKVLATYYDTLFATAGLVNYWRLGEAATSTDSFTGTAGTTLQAHTGEIGAGWTKNTSISNSDTVITAAGRIRKGTATTSFSEYYSSALPATANYTVEADVYVASNLAGDVAGITARVDPAIANGTFYSAIYDQALGQWILYSVVNGTKTSLGTSTAALTVGSTYRLDLVVTGTSIRLLVNGVQLVSVVNAAVSAAGRGGVVFGNGTTTTTDTDIAGMHLDNFLVTPRIADNKTANPGDYFGPKLGVAGAIANEPDTAATFDGINDFGAVTETVTNDFSVEFWFKSTQGIGIGGTTWQSGAGLVDANITGNSKDWGISLSADGHIIAGDGNGTVDFSVVSTTGGYDDGVWHQVDVTRSVTTGLIQIYVDGVANGSVTGSTLALTAPTINFGRLASPGNYYAGDLDEITLYNTVLSQATVSAHYAAAQ